MPSRVERSRAGAAKRQLRGLSLLAAKVMVIVATAAVLVAVPSAQRPAQAAGVMNGHDISWPQCSSASGGYGLPLPPSSSDFTIIGLTRGRAFTENPCLASQVKWAIDNGVPTHGYTMTAFPTQDQLNAYSTAGPFSASTRAGQLANVGFAEAQFGLASMSRIGWHPSVVWVDVESLASQPWPSGTATTQAENRYVVQGVLRGLRDAGVGYGIYSVASAWQTIVGSWSLPGVPVWIPVGTLNYAEEAADACNTTSFSKGPVYLSQWTDGTRDYNRTCGAYQFTSLPINLAGRSQAKVTSSSVDTAISPSAAAAVDGLAEGYPVEPKMEWSSNHELGGSWLQVTWTTPVTLASVVLNDRPNLNDGTLGGVLTFSDGSKVTVGALPNDGAALSVAFTKRAVTWVRFTASTVRSSTWAAGLAEFEAWGTVGGTPSSPSPATAAVSNVARVAGVSASASSENVGSGQTAAKVVDGSAVGYPGDYTREWATVGGKSGSWVQLDWTAPVTLSKVVLFDRPNSSDQVTSGVLTFSDGSTQAVTSLSNAGGATSFSFAARATKSVRLTVTGVSATTQNVGLAEFEAWGRA